MRNVSKFAVFIILLSISFNLPAQQKSLGKILINKAVDKRKIVYDEKELFKKYGYFTKDYLIGGDISLSADIDEYPYISENPVDKLITQVVEKALKFCNFDAIESPSNDKVKKLDIEIKRLFIHTAEVGTAVGYGSPIISTLKNSIYYPSMEIKLYMRDENKNLLFEKTFFYYDQLWYYSFPSSKSMVNFLSDKLFNQLIVFFQSDAFLELYNGKKNAFKEYIQYQSYIDKIPDSVPRDVNELVLSEPCFDDDLSFAGNYDELVELNLPANPFMKKIGKLNNLNNLEFLMLNRYQYLRDIDNIKLFEKLCYLDLSGDPKIKSYKSINSLKKLKYITFEGNNIKKIEYLNNLSDLLILNLNLNMLTKIENLTNNRLVKLSLNENKISKIENLENLTNLMELDLFGNKIKKIENLDKLSNLRILDLNSNPISKIENLNKLVNLEILSLWGAKINKIENLDDLENLKALNLGYNKNICKIENLDKLTKLKILNLKGTGIKQVENINNLVNLEELYLGNTKINELNSGIKNLKNIRILDVSKTDVKTLDFIKNLTELNTLNITDSKITRLENIEKCPKLKKIMTNDNQIKEITKASFDFLKNHNLMFYENSLDEFIKKQNIKIVD